MASTTAAGSRFAISAGTPATMDATGFAALTYTVVKGIDQLGSFGETTEVVNFQPLDGPLEKYKGPFNAGGIQPSFAVDNTDAGQAALRAASVDRTQKLYAFRTFTSDGDVEYNLGRVFGFPQTVGAANTMKMANPTIEYSTSAVRVPAT